MGLRKTNYSFLQTDEICSGFRKYGIMGYLFKEIKII